jgi:hypothetical protein
MKLYFTRKEILMGRDVANPLTPEMESNLTKLIEALSIVRHAYGKPLQVSSGYRPSDINKAAGGANRSAHMTCQACDLVDSNREFANWCINNLNILKQAGLYLEDPRWTPRWVHLQIRRPGSGNRVFKLTTPPVDPFFWDGKYDLKFN